MAGSSLHHTFDKVRDVEDIEGIIAFVRAHYPEFQNTDFEIPAQGNQKTVLLTPNEAIAVANNPPIEKLMQKEASILRRLPGDSVHVATPRVIDFKQDANILRMTRLDGTALSGDRLLCMPPGKQTDLCERLGLFLATLHIIFPLTRQDLEDSDQYWKKLVDINVSLIFDQEASLADRERLMAVKHYRTIYNDLQDDLVIVHGDLHADNMLYDAASDMLGLIDFTGARPNKRHREFCKLYTSMPEHLYHRIVDVYEEKTGAKINQALVKQGLDALDVATWQPGLPPFRAAPNLG